MEFVIFQRADSALLVVPALFQPPISSQASGPIHAVGRCDVELDDFSPAVAASLSEKGFAEIDDGDLQVVRSALEATRIQELDAG